MNTMQDRPKILLLDDDPGILELYPELLGQLSCKPEVITCASGARAIALLEAEPVSLFICDLNLPQMDGLQVLTVVRRKYPQLRTVVLSSVTDEQFRTRAYALGLDLCFVKPTNARETQLFLDCIESLLEQKEQTGFRGIQSKSMLDIIQLESLCRNTSTLKVINGTVEGRIWFQDGEVVDAEVGGVTAQPAFLKIISWKKGNFECIPGEHGRARKIFSSIDGLLLESAQIMDEGQAGQASGSPEGGTSQSGFATAPRKHFEWSSLRGLEFGLVLAGSVPNPLDAWAVEEPQALADWTRKTVERCNALGEALHIGKLDDLTALGLRTQVGVAQCAERLFCLGFHYSQTGNQIKENLKKVVDAWVS